TEALELPGSERLRLEGRRPRWRRALQVHADALSSNHCRGTRELARMGEAERQRDLQGAAIRADREWASGVGMGGGASEDGEALGLDAEPLQGPACGLAPCCELRGARSGRACREEGALARGQRLRADAAHLRPAQRQGASSDLET